MSTNVDELTAETSKLAMNSKIPLNWCDLPLEMRSECIQRMDFKTKIRLRATSTTEKSLVEADKHYYHFGTVEIIYKFKKLRVNSENGVRARADCPNEVALSCILHILKFGKIDTLKLAIWGKIDEFFAEFEKIKPFRFENLRSECTDQAATLFFLKNAARPVEMISLDISKDMAFELSKFLELPTPKLLRVEHLSIANSLSFFEVVQHWMFNDTEIGTKLEISDGEFGAGIQFSYDKMRFPTQNPSKDVLMRRGKNIVLRNDYILAEVIPSDYPDSGEDDEDDADE